MYVIRMSLNNWAGWKQNPEYYRPLDKDGVCTCADIAYSNKEATQFNTYEEAEIAARNGGTDKNGQTYTGLSSYWSFRIVRLVKKAK